jgi:hypothetical protein
MGFISRCSAPAAAVDPSSYQQGAGDDELEAAKQRVAESEREVTDFAMQLNQLGFLFLESYSRNITGELLAQNVGEVAALNIKYRAGGGNNQALKKKIEDAQRIVAIQQQLADAHAKLHVAQQELDAANSRWKMLHENYQGSHLC